MELILDIPMLADHRDEGGGRPHQTGNVEAIATGDRRVLVRHPNRFHGYDRLGSRICAMRINISAPREPPERGLSAGAHDSKPVFKSPFTSLGIYLLYVPT